MKIYFSASRFYREEYKKNYESIDKILEEKSATVFDSSKLRSVPLGFEMPDFEKKKIYKEITKMMDKSDLCVFEASYPSTLHIGHEITLAMEKNKPVVVLYVKGREPILFRGIDDKKVWWVEYESNNLEEKLRSALDEAEKNFDVRFNFFVSPKILSYLDWIAQKRMIPRSVFLRNLIEREMKKDKEFKE